MTGRVFTIGYGNRDVGAFWAALYEAQIQILIDVRSAPYSRHRPEFSKKPLARAALDRGIEYRFLGAELGGRPDAPICYVDGKVVYARCRERAPFREGIVEVVALAEDGKISCLMCAEEDPTNCHRDPASVREYGDTLLNLQRLSLRLLEIDGPARL